MSQTLVGRGSYRIELSATIRKATRNEPFVLLGVFPRVDSELPLPTRRRWRLLEAGAPWLRHAFSRMLGLGRPSAQGAQSPQAWIRSDPLLLGGDGEIHLDRLSCRA